MNTEDTVPDFFPEDIPDQPPKLTVTSVMTAANECLEEMGDRDEMLDERLHNVFEIVGLLAIAINAMMTSKQLIVPVPALGMRTIKELF